MRSVRILLGAAFGAALALPPDACAATIAGVVRAAGGDPLPGTMVSLLGDDRRYVETVYSDDAGRFRLRTELEGALSVRARAPYHGDDERPLVVERGQNHDLVFELVALDAPEAISASQPALAHYARIRFAQPADEPWFQVDCLTCHQLGNAYTRAPRQTEHWHRILTRMLGFYGVTDAAWIERYAAALERAFDGTPVTGRYTAPVDPMIYAARIIEWKLPEGVIAHDVEYNPDDGLFYTVDQGNDRIYITDPRTRVTEEFRIPRAGIPVGGKFFARYGDANPFGLSVARGPHSLQRGPDGHYYTTDTVSGQIGEFDPKARTYVGHDIGGDAMYPHTLRFDRRGRVWFTLGASNQVGFFDTVHDEMRVIDLPDDTARPQMPASMPYGIDVHPGDGSVWYSALMADRIGRIDPDTLDVELFEPPLVGPRRMRFSADGTLWIPGFGDGVLVALDTATMAYRRYPIPSLVPGEAEAPYAVGVHPQTQEVWITANMSDRMFRFLPREERFVAYPLPVRGIYLRDVVFTPQGWVCAASSPVPAALAVEGGMQEIVCIDPDGTRAPD